MRLSKKILEEIKYHALETYPDECCGILTGNTRQQNVHRCQNIQNRLHAEDPVRYSRDARTAYAIDTKVAEKIYANAKKNKEDIVGFYHSHTEHAAYFSDIDKEVQTVFGEPEYPDAIHIVISIKRKNVCDIKCYKWDKQKKDFIFQGCI